MFTKSTVVIDFFVFNLMSINENEDSFSMLFTTNLTWYDPRLRYNFLHNTTKVTGNDTGGIWKPDIQFAVTKEFSNIQKSIFIERETDATLHGNVFNSIHPTGKIKL